MADPIAGLGLARLDFERGAVAGEVICSVEGDSTPTSQQEEEARIATLAYALKKLGNSEDAAEFMRCLNAICEAGDARYRQIAASYYYGEIVDAAPVFGDSAEIRTMTGATQPLPISHLVNTPNALIRLCSSVSGGDARRHRWPHARRVRACDSPLRPNLAYQRARATAPVNYSVISGLRRRPTMVSHARVRS
jgi:hypothetical protein